MKKVSLVLGSGGARGYVHIGVIETLEARGYEIVSVSGCSMGALVGGVYACGKLAEYKAWVQGLEPLDVTSLLDLAWDKRGIMSGSKVFERLDELIGTQTIEGLPIRFTAVASDLNLGKEVWFQSGDLLTAIRASVAARYSSFAERLASKAKNAIKERLRRQEQAHIFSILDQSFDTMQRSLTQYRIGGYPPDIMITLPKNICSTFDFHKAAMLIEAGRRAVEEHPALR
ncbi:MAG: patatin-like phospholipase family protein [Campylobacterales bacterium]|nr:patatin-like phospholipase family protein [Campylobacterales bacterium]